MRRTPAKAAFGLLVLELPYAALASYLVMVNLGEIREESLWLAVGALTAIGIGWLAPKSIWIPLRVGIVATLAGLTLVEAWLWILPPREWSHQFESLPVLFEPHPNPAIGYWYCRGIRYHGVTIGETRIASPPVTIPKPANVRRIVVLGDSTVQLIDDYQRLFPVTLERMLREASRGGTVWEVVNCGVEGYNTRQEVERYREDLWKLQPDLIILGYCLNDPYPSSFSTWSRCRVRLARVVAILVEQWRHHAITNIRNLHASSYYHEIVEDSLAGLAALAKRDQAVTMAFIFPYLLRGTVPFDPVYEQVWATLNANGFRLVDLHSGWTNSQFERFRIKDRQEDVIHPNGDFHDIVARRLFEAIQADGWLDSEPRAAQRVGE